MRQSTIALLGVLGGVIFAAWFFTTHEKVTRVEFAGYRGEARVNQFLAADLLLNELGIDAESRSSLRPSDWQLSSEDTLVTSASTTFAVGEERDLLISWVADGGHLVLLPPQQESRGVEEFLDFLGFGLVEFAADEQDDADAGQQDDGDSETFDYIVDLDSTWYRIELGYDEDLGATLSDEKGIVAARRNWGAGFITMVATTNYFRNGFLETHDHARLLLDVVAGYVEPGTVWFVYDAFFPSLWQVIWNNAPFVVIGFVITILLWLWSIIPMFGPGIRQQAMERRSIIEHVTAAGQFVWRNHGARALATSSAAAVMHEAESKHPGIKRLPMQKQAEQLARMTGLPAQAVMDVLVNRDEPRQREFTHNMQALQRIRNEL